MAATGRGTLASFLAGSTNDFAAQTRRQIDGAPDDGNDNFANVVATLVTVTGLRGQNKSDAFTIVGQPPGAVVDPSEDEVEQSMEAFLRSQQVAGGPTNVDELTQRQIVDGLRAGSIVFNDGIWAQVEQAADIARETFEKVLGFDRYTIEEWTQALIATKDVRLRFADLVVTNQNVALANSPAVNNARQERNAALRARTAARGKLLSLEDEVADNLDAAGPVTQIRPRMV
jgi:hypothetical protein